MSDEPSDLTLVDAYRSGDAAAFDSLFRRYHQRIRNLCLRYLGDTQAAEDLVQETFFNVVKSLNRVDATYNFGAWIHRIAVNLCHDELRRRERQRQHIESGGDDTEETVLRLIDRDRHGHPEAALEITHLRRLVWEVAKRLPERQRLALTLRELQGLSYASIGHVMNISQSAVETLLFRARKRFREEYLALESDATLGGVEGGGPPEPAPAPEAGEAVIGGVVAARARW